MLNLCIKMGNQYTKIEHLYTLFGELCIKMANLYTLIKHLYAKTINLFLFVINTEVQLSNIVY